MPPDPPMHVYPDPDGNPDNQIPSSEPLALGAIAAGAGAVGTTGAGVALGLILPPGTASANTSMALILTTEMDENWIYLSIALGGLSVILQTWNYIRGKRIKERNVQASRDVCEVVGVKPVLKKHGWNV